MKLKRIMLITLVLLAILTIGAVSASDDTDLNETLTVDNIDEVSVDASVDDELISESDDDVVAVSEEDIVSDGNSTIIQPELAVSVGDADYGDPVNVEIRINGVENGSLNVCLDNELNYTVLFVNSFCSLSFNDLSSGIHKLDVIYPGDYAHAAAMSSLRFYYIQKNPDMAVDMKYCYHLGDTVNVAISFEDNVSGIVFATLNNVTYNSTLLNGSCYFEFNNLDIGIHMLIIQYDDNENYSTTKSKSFIILPQQYTTDFDYYYESHESISKDEDIVIQVFSEVNEGILTLYVISDEGIIKTFNANIENDVDYYHWRYWWRLNDLNLEDLGYYKFYLTYNDEFIVFEDIEFQLMYSNIEEHKEDDVFINYPFDVLRIYEQPGILEVYVNGSENISQPGYRESDVDWYPIAWNLEELGITSPGTYDIFIKTFDNSHRLVETFTMTLNVVDLNNSQYHIFTNYESIHDFDGNHPVIYLYCPVNSTGNVTVYVNDNLVENEFSVDSGNMISWTLSDLGITMNGNYNVKIMKDDVEIASTELGVWHIVNVYDNVELWINTEDEFSTNPDDLGAIFATVTIPKGIFGQFFFLNDENVVFNNDLGMFIDGAVNGSKYNIALGYNGNFIFEGLKDGDHIRFLFLENGTELAGQDYLIFFGDNTVRFEIDAHNPGDHVSIDVSGDELSADDDNDFVWINIPSDVTEGKVLVTSGDYILFEESVNFDEGTHWWTESDGHYVCSFAPISLTNWDKLNTEGTVTFAFLDENDEVLASKNYVVTINEGNVRFEECRYIEVGIWNEDDERGTLFTDSEGNVVSVDVPNVFEGNILIYVNGEEKINWEIEFDGEDSTYRDWGLEELEISQAGNYTIEVIYDNGENNETLLNEIISVRNFENDEFRAMIQYTTETIRLYVPENSDGNVTIITEKEIENGDLEQINEETYEITSEDYGNWKVWALSDLGFEADGAFRIFTLTITDTTGNEIYRYKIAHVDGENQHEDDWYDEQIEFAFVTINNDGDMEFNKTSDVVVAKLYIPDTDEYSDVNATVYIKLNGELIKTIRISDLSDLNVNNHYPIAVDLFDLNDKDMLTFTVEAIHTNNSESAIDEDNEWVLILEDNGEYFIGHDDYDPKRLEFEVFRGNLTTGTTNDPELMGPNFNGNFVIVTISNALGITEGTVTVNDGTNEIFSKSISECVKEYDYGSVGYTYYITLDEIMDYLTEGKDLLVSFNYGDNSLIQKRIRFDDYLYKIVLTEDITNQVHFEANEDLILHESDTAIHLWTETNRQSIYIEYGGGYFIVYVNGTKVENLGNVSFNTWKNMVNLKDDNDYMNNNYPTVNGIYPNETAFFNYVRSYWGDELELFRLTSYNQGASEIDITLADLGITQSGTYNIRIVHYPSVPGGLDDHSTIGEYYDGTYAEEYFSPDYTEVFNANITCNLDPDYAGVEIITERIYKNGQPFLITFQLGDNVLSESNRIFVYLNGELAFNGTTLFWEENDDGEMELFNLWKLNDGQLDDQLDEYPLNEYGVLDVGEYEAVVYLVKGDAAPVEIGRGNFTVLKQRGNMSFEMGSSSQDDGVHTVLYVDIPEGNWDGYSLSINIADSEEIYPNEEDWFARWYDEYVIFKDNNIALKESLDNIIGKGPVAIDLGVLDEGTHIWVMYGHGEETVFGDWDFYQYDFTVRASIVPADSNLKVTAEDITVDETAVVNIEMDEAVNGEILVSVDGVVSYTVTVTNGKASLNISYLSAGVHNVTAKFEGNENYNPVENITSFTVSKLIPVIVIAAGEAVEGSDLDVTVELDSDATGSVDVNGEVIALVDGKASATIKNLEAGELNVTVVYSGDAKYVNASETKKVTVKAKEDTGLVVSVGNIEFGDVAVVSIEINANVTGKVTINGNEIAIINGKGSYNLSALDAGVHNITVVFEGDKYFNACEKTATFTVSKLTPVIVITAGEAVEGSDLDVTVEMAADATGSVDVNGEVIVLVDGKASATIKNLDAGEFNIVVVYSGDAKYVNASESKKVTVKAKEDAGLVVSVGNIGFGDVAVVSIEINANVTGKVTINGNEIAIINGKGSYNLSALDAGVHNVTVVFEGDKYFNACEKTATFTVTAKIVQVNPELAIAPVSDIEEGSDVVITISALGNFTGAVSVLVGDSEVGVVNVNDGSATFTIGAGNFTVGLNTVKITSAASENFTAGENSSTFTVTAKVLPKTITKDTLSNYFDENGVYVADLDEIIFVGEFTDIPKITINKAVNITGQNAVFTNTLFNINSDNVAVKDLTINTALTDYAITVTGSNQVSLINNNINAINGILISDSANFIIDSNNILSTAGVNINGIYINGTGSGIVRNNNLNLKSAKTAYAINTNPTGLLKVSYINNTIYAESYFAVGIYDDAEEIRDNKITLSGNYAIGIAVLSENAVVDNNGITLSTTNTGSEVIDEPLGVETAGIKVNNSATITNNDVDSTGKSVSVVGGSSTISDNNLNGQVSLESDGNTISGNVITTTEESAIDASSSTGNTISSNEAYSSTGNGDNAIKAAEGNTVKDNFEKFDPALTVSVADITEGANAVITVKTNNTFSGNVSVKIATDNYTVEVIKGTGSLPVSGLAVGTHTAIATLKATDVFTESVKNTTFTVKAKVATAISAPAVTTTYATSKNIVVSLKDVSGNVLAGKSVTVVFNGATKTLTTDDKGQVSLAIGTSLVPKTYDATFTFAGDDTYAKSSGSIKVTVKKATPKLAAKKKTFKAKKAKKYTVTLKTDKGKALNNVKVTLKVKGKKYTATVKKGKATFNLKKLTKKGNYKATVTFAGNKYYNKAVVKNVKITVKK